MCKLLILGITLLIFTSPLATANEVTIRVYTDRADWEAALSGPIVTEGFSEDQLNAAVSFVSSESRHINPSQECFQDLLASFSFNEPNIICSFRSEIIAQGGNWTLGGFGNSLRVYVYDLPIYVGFISNSYDGEFCKMIDLLRNESCLLTA